jgi:hypothetical protein
LEIEIKREILKYPHDGKDTARFGRVDYAFNNAVIEGITAR